MIHVYVSCLITIPTSTHDQLAKNHLTMIIFLVSVCLYEIMEIKYDFTVKHIRNG